jgi:hypothetical protein
MTMTARTRQSLDALMDNAPALLLVAADAARARARETGTPIVVMRDGKLVHEYDPPPLAEELRGEAGDVKRA